MVGFCENSVPGLQMAPPTHPLCLAWSFLGVKRKPERDREPLVSLLVRTVVLSGQGSIGKPLLLLFSGSVGRESICNVGDPGSIPGSGRSIGEGKGYPLQYSGLENSMDCIVHKVTKRQILLSSFHSLKCITFRPKYDIKLNIRKLVLFTGFHVEEEEI